MLYIFYCFIPSLFVIRSQNERTVFMKGMSRYFCLKLCFFCWIPFPIFLKIHRLSPLFKEFVSCRLRFYTCYNALNQYCIWYFIMLKEPFLMQRRAFCEVLNNFRFIILHGKGNNSMKGKLLWLWKKGYINVYWIYKV